MGQRLCRALDWCADNVGNVYLLALAVAVVGAVGLVVVLALASV